MRKISLVILWAILLVAPPHSAFGQIRIDGIPISQQKATLFLSPSSGSFLAGSTFEVSLFIDTLNESINAVEAHIKFPTDKLTVISPSGGKSIIGVWLAPPGFSNSNGLIDFTGIVPGGIVTRSGLIATITFKAKTSGNASIRVLSSSQVLANDGVGTEIATDYGRADLTLLPVPPAGPRVFSETHPFEDRWYNNTNPILGWEKEPGVSDFSFVLDDTPLTIPDNLSDSGGTRASFESIPNGIGFFHIKSKKDGAWGQATHFAIRIDTIPPAKFSPTFDVLAAVASRVLVSFSTTDSLSGIDHYEVGVLDVKAPKDVTPLFLETESPYQIPANIGEGLKIIVRAFDRAGNSQDGILKINSSWLLNLLRQNWLLLLSLIIIALAVTIHRLFGDHVLRKLQYVWKVLRRNKNKK